MNTIIHLGHLMNTIIPFRTFDETFRIFDETFRIFDEYPFRTFDEYYYSI